MFNVQYWCVICTYMPRTLMLTVIEYARGNMCVVTCTRGWLATHPLIWASMVALPPTAPPTPTRCGVGVLGRRGNWKRWSELVVAAAKFELANLQLIACKRTGALQEVCWGHVFRSTLVFFLKSSSDTTLVIWRSIWDSRCTYKLLARISQG